MIDNKTISVRINQQQEVLLERLRQEGKLGDTIAEVLLNLLRAHAAQMREKNDI